MQCRVKNTREFDNRVNAAVGAHMKGYRKKIADNSWTLPTRDRQYGKSFSDCTILV
jgi:hypothetical protein